MFYARPKSVNQNNTAIRKNDFATLDNPSLVVNAIGGKQISRLAT